MPDSTATLRYVTQVFALEPPVDVPRRYADGMYRIHSVHRTVADGIVTGYSFHGVPLTKAGNPNGAQDWRAVHDDDKARLAALLPPVCGGVCEPSV